MRLADFLGHENKIASRGPLVGQPKRVATDITRHLSVDHLRELRNACLFAAAKGMPLNTFLTVNFVSWQGKDGWKGGSDAEGSIKRLRKKLLERLAYFAETQGFPVARVQVLENPERGGTGPHIHVLMHMAVENHAQLKAELSGRIIVAMELGSAELARLKAERDRLRSSGEWKAADAIRTPFHFRDSQHNPGGPLSGKEVRTRLRYMAKGADPDIITADCGSRETLLQHSRKMSCGAEYRLPDMPNITLEKPGDVRVCARAASSHSIGKKARREAGWVEDNSLAWLSRKVERNALFADVFAILREHKAEIPSSTASDLSVVFEEMEEVRRPEDLGIPLSSVV